MRASRRIVTVLVATVVSTLPAAPAFAQSVPVTVEIVGNGGDTPGGTSGGTPPDAPASESPAAPSPTDAPTQAPPPIDGHPPAPDAPADDGPPAAPDAPEAPEAPAAPRVEHPVPLPRTGAEILRVIRDAAALIATGVALVMAARPTEHRSRS